MTLHPAAMLAVLTLPACMAGQTKPALDPAMAEIAAAYAAKVTASAIFVSGRTLESVLAEELAPNRPLEALIRPFLRFDVDRDQRCVTAKLGKATAVAIATQYLGCTLVHGDVDEPALRQLRQRGFPLVDDARLDPDTIDWPLGDRIAERSPADGTDQVDHVALSAAIDRAFAEPTGGKKKIGTRAIVVVHQGQLVAERYAEGYDRTMPLPGWSMTKTMVNALVGIRVQQGKLDLDAPLAVPEWPIDDPRRTIQWQHLLTMTSGLQWNEDYDDPASDALQMLFRSEDHAAVQTAQRLAAVPGATYAYASGTTNLVCRELRRTFASDAEYLAFPRQALFGRLGMRSALIEADPSGTFVGSSYGFATARDWARFGTLYAGDGTFAGERILPDGWIAESARAFPAGKGRFGRHVWLNADPDGDGPMRRMWPDLPADLLHMDGHEGQYVCVMPTEQIVVVRLGCTKSGGFDLTGLLRAVRTACGGK